jgi:hypothetical protein
VADAALGQLAEEVVDDLLFLLAALLGLLELVVVYHTGNHLLLLDIEIVLSLLKGLP